MESDHQHQRVVVTEVSEPLARLKAFAEEPAHYMRIGDYRSWEPHKIRIGGLLVAYAIVDKGDGELWRELGVQTEGRPISPPEFKLIADALGFHGTPAKDYFAGPVEIQDELMVVGIQEIVN